MQDNFTDDTIELLIKYMDDELSESEKASTELLLQKDETLKEQYNLLLAAKQAIRSLGLKQQVQTLQREYLTETTAPLGVVETNTQKIEPVKVVKKTSFVTTFLRIAAVFIVAVAGIGVWQFSSTSNNSLYSDNYMDYRLPVNRREGQTDNIASLYNSGNYAAVINAERNNTAKSQQDYFLEAQSYLHTDNANAAINSFQQLENLNNNSKEKYFVQETDYYLALAFIKAGNIDAAELQLDKITNDSQHLYYSKAKQISRTKLSILKWKINK